MSIEEKIMALDDDTERGGIFVYDFHGSQADEFEVADLKTLVTELAQARAERKDLMMALESLTPLGSEFAGDSKACVDYVRGRYAATNEAAKKHVREKRELEAERDRYKAMLAQVYDIKLLDGQTITGYRRNQQDAVKWHVVGNATTYSTALEAFEALTEAAADAGD